MFIIHSKARKFFLLLDPHHCITTVMVHEQQAKTPCEGSSEKVCSCKEENMDNLLVVVSQTIFFSGAWRRTSNKPLTSLSIPLTKKGQSDVNR